MKDTLRITKDNEKHSLDCEEISKAKVWITKQQLKT